MRNLITTTQRILQAGNDDSIKLRVSSTFLWSIAELSVSNSARFISSLILSRLLMPEAFGLMAVANTVMMGLGMFSDLGLNANIIQNPKGDREDFLQTAWTLQVIRGFILGAVACILAWPMAIMNDMPDLKWIMPILAFSPMITGFNSTFLACYEKRMTIGPRVLFQALNTVLGTTLTILLVWRFRSVGALLATPFFCGTFWLILSHTILGGGMHMRFRWDHDQLREVLSFSIWIFFSTMLMFLVSRTDVLVLGALAGAGTLGVYSYAKNLAGMPLAPVSNLCNRLLLPLYAESLRKGPEVLRNRAYKVRLTLYAIFLPMGWILILFGSPIIRFLYPERFWEAGWMMSILCAGACCTLVRNSMVSIFLASGDSFGNLVNQAIRFVIMIAAMAVGYALYGYVGLIAGFALTDLLYYPVFIAYTKHYGIWFPSLDAAAFGLTGFFGALTWILHSYAIL